MASPVISLEGGYTRKCVAAGEVLMAHSILTVIRTFGVIR